MRPNLENVIQSAIRSLRLNDDAKKTAMFNLAIADPADDAVFTAAITGINVNPPLNAAELAALNLAARQTICSQAAFQYYELFINSVTAADAANLLLLKQIADKPAPGVPDDFGAIKGRLSGAYGVALGAVAPAVPAAAPVVPAPLPHLNMLQEEETKNLRRLAAEKYVRLKLEAALAAEPDPLVAWAVLKNGRPVDQYRAAFGVDAAHGDPQFQLLDFGADKNNEDVLSNTQIKGLFDAVQKECKNSIWKSRLTTMNQQANATINGGPVTQVTMNAIVEGGLIKLSEFQSLLPRLVKDLLADQNPGQVITDALAKPDLDRAKQNISVVERDAAGQEKAYTVKLPGKLELTQRAVGENAVETRISSIEISDSAALFLAMARSLACRYTEILKQDIATQELVITEYPTFTDKSGNSKDPEILKQELMGALTKVGFGRVRFAPKAALKAELLPNRLGAAPVVVPPVHGAAPVVVPVVPPVHGAAPVVVPVVPPVHGAAQVVPPVVPAVHGAQPPLPPAADSSSDSESSVEVARAAPLRDPVNNGAPAPFNAEEDELAAARAVHDAATSFLESSSAANSPQAGQSGVVDDLGSEDSPEEDSKDGHEAAQNARLQELEPLVATRPGLGSSGSGE